jgi:hypothetical protein
VVVSFRIGSSAVAVVVVAVESELYSFLVSSIRVGASEREASSLLNGKPEQNKIERIKIE